MPELIRIANGRLAVNYYLKYSEFELRCTNTGLKMLTGQQFVGGNVPAFSRMCNKQTTYIILHHDKCTCAKTESEESVALHTQAAERRE